MYFQFCASDEKYFQLILSEKKMTTEKLLFYLIRNQIKGENLPENLYLSGEIMPQLYRLSVWHDLAHVVGNALICNNLFSNDKMLELFNQQIFLAVYRYEQQKAELEKISEAFNSAKIIFIPLKGVVVREFYPEPWMRTSCDIDILIHEEDVDKAQAVLIENGYKTDSKKGLHDIHFYNENIHIELHYNVCEGVSQIDELLSKVWDYSEKVAGYKYAEKTEYYVFHHVAHMAYHFLAGGCGIRPFIDLWLLQQKGFYDEEKLLPLLEKSNLVKFYRSVCKLMNLWMNGGEYDELAAQLNKYIISGGIYGNKDNESVVGAANHKGKKRYIFKIAFPSYKRMCIIYPSLKKHKLLLPFYYIHRIYIKVLGRDRNKVKSKINKTMSQQNDKISDMKLLLKALDLKK